MKTLYTERLILRLVSVDDAPFILELYNHPDFYRFVGDKQIRTEYEAARYIKENMLRMQQIKGVSLLVVRRKKMGNPSGFVGWLNVTHYNTMISDMDFYLPLMATATERSLQPQCWNTLRK